MFSNIILFCLLGCANKKEEIKNEEKQKQIVFKQPNQKDCNQDFEMFFEKFSRDSLFQKDRVNYPIDYSFYEDVTSEETTIEIIRKPSEFDYINFKDDLEAKNKEYDRFSVVKEKKSDLFLYKRIGIDNGIRETYSFMKIRGCWFLVSILDEST
ncbi:DUF4348 domain-containing protein [Aquimarina rhabdastrellae]